MTKHHGLAPSDGPSRPRAWIVCPHFGAPSEPWIWRQVVRFGSIAPTVVTSEWVDQTTYPLAPVRVVVDPRVVLDDTGWTRWPKRLRKARRGNFAALEPKALRALVEVAGRIGPPDILLCHFGHTAVRFLPLAEELGIPIVAHFHGLDLSSSLGNRWYRWSLECALPQLAAMVVVGAHQGEMLRSLGAETSRIHHIPCGVPVDEYPLRAGPSRPSSTHFTAVSRLVPWKGVDVTLRAFATVVRAGIDAELTVLGDGPQRQELETLADTLGVRSRVAFLGWCPPSQVQSSLAATDVFLQHSRRYRGWVEGFGVSIVEAAASGIPVVVSDCGGIAEHVADGVTGFVVEQEDVDGMADRMRRLAEDPRLRDSMGRVARRRTVENFDTAAQVARLEHVLLEVVDGAGTGT